MDKKLFPGSLSGAIDIPASKSRAHRLLITAALSDSGSSLGIDGISDDIAATISCLRSLGADIAAGGGSDVTVNSGILKRTRAEASGPLTLACGESGSTLRFLLPLVGLTGADAVFDMKGRLPERPLAPFDSELTRHGMTIEKRGTRLFCSGRLSPGRFTLPGNVSSQYVSALLMALPALDGESVVEVKAPVESASYIDMTEDALKLAGVSFEKRGGGDLIYVIPGNQKYELPGHVRAEGDWSSAAPFLCMGAVSDKGITVSGLDPDSAQGDRRILDVLREMGADVSFGITRGANTAEGLSEKQCITVRRGALKGTTVDASDIPDLVPAISALASMADGITRITNAERLRLKESDRLATTAAMLKALGASAEETRDGLLIYGRGSAGSSDFPAGGTADSAGDHRIAMAAAVASLGCAGPVVVKGAECVSKSYPAFWDDLSALSAGNQ